MHKVIALRFALPAIVIVAIVTIALIALTLTTHVHGAAGFPGCC